MANLAKKELIMREMEQIPEPLFNEILDFRYFLKTKALKENWKQQLPVNLP